MSSHTARAWASPPLARCRDHPSLQRRVPPRILFVRSPALFMRGMSTRPRGAIVDEDVPHRRAPRTAHWGQPSTFLKPSRCHQSTRSGGWTTWLRHLTSATSHATSIESGDPSPILPTGCDGTQNVAT